MEKNTQNILANIKNRPLWVKVLGIISIPLFVLSVLGITFALLVN